MVKAKLYNQEGQATGEAKLNQSIFGIKVIPALVKQAVVSAFANRRPIVSHTKDRSEVRGGGKKPWRQKGTGRARHGSSRSPIWIGGGITFGPRKERNFARKINKKMKKKALFMVLSDKVQNETLAVLEKLELTEAKTKTMAALFSALKLKSILVVIAKADQSVSRATRNIPKAKAVSVNGLSIVDLLKYQNVLFTRDALKELEIVFLKKVEK